MVAVAAPRQLPRKPIIIGGIVFAWLVLWLLFRNIGTLPLDASALTPLHRWVNDVNDAVGASRNSNPVFLYLFNEIRLVIDEFVTFVQALIAPLRSESFGVGLEHHVDGTGAQHVTGEPANRTTHCVALHLGHLAVDGHHQEHCLGERIDTVECRGFFRTEQAGSRQSLVGAAQNRARAAPTLQQGIAQARYGLGLDIHGKIVSYTFAATESTGRIRGMYGCTGAIRRPGGSRSPTSTLA